MLIWKCQMSSPLGPIVVGFSARGLRQLEFGPAGEDPSLPACDAPPERWMADILAALRDYFAGRAIDIKALQLDLQGTPFQLRVWQEMAAIPWGRTISYRELARRAGKPGASRAAGQACGKNPVPVIIPCHRVVRSDGSLGGFSAGLEKKRWLLEHEN